MTQLFTKNECSWLIINIMETLFFHATNDTAANAALSCRRHMAIILRSKNAMCWRSA